MGFGVERLVLPDPEVRARVRYAAFHAYAPGPMAEVTGNDTTTVMLRPSDWWLAWAATPGEYDADGRCLAFSEPMIYAHGLGYDIAATEWNWNGWRGHGVDLGPGVTWRQAAAVGVGGFLNGLLRQANAIRIANQSMLVGHGWEIAAIKLDQTGTLLYRNAQGAVTTFYNRRHGDRVLALSTANIPLDTQPYHVGWAKPKDAVALLDVIATRDDHTLYLHGVNRAYDNDLSALLDVTALTRADGGVIMHHLDAVPDDQVATAKSWTAERRQTVTMTGGSARVTFPRRSLSILEISLREE